jgi:PAP2 superfamily protein
MSMRLLPSPALQRSGRARFAALELAIWASVYGTYLAVRGLTIGSPHTALMHAAEVVDVERAVGCFREAALQERLAPVADAFSTYYMLGFGPVVAAMALWLGLRRRESYRGFRNALLLSVGVATLAYVFFPTAPPRLAGLGIQDTVGLSSHDTGSFLGIRFNPYAAVPSMHVGWSVLVAYFGFTSVRNRLARVLFVAHPVVMAVTVTATGNHFFFDSVTGAAVACLTLAVLERRRRPARPRLRLVAGGGERAFEDAERKAA